MSVAPPGGKFYFNSMKELRLKDVKELVLGLEAKKYWKRETNPGNLIVKLMVQALCQET